MYYHCTELKYVQYGKIHPAPEDACDDHFIHAYRWLGHYCGYCPQIWLARCNMGMTGFRSRRAPKDDCVLFGFDTVVGAFPVDYDLWHFFLSFAGMYPEDKPDDLAARVFSHVLTLDMECLRGDPQHDLLSRGAETVEEWLKSGVFQSEDHFVLPNINLKSAKQIICRNERQKKKLRRKGFIEDRIKIKNVSTYDW